MRLDNTSPIHDNEPLYISNDVFVVLLHFTVFQVIVPHLGSSWLRLNLYEKIQTLGSEQPRT